MHQTGFSSAAVLPQSKFTELCRSAAVVSQSKSCVARQPLYHKVNPPRYEAWRRHSIMTCDIFGTGQTNTLTLGYLLGKTYKPAHCSATLESLKSRRSTKLLEKLLTWAAHTLDWRLWRNSFCQQVDDWMLLKIAEKIIRRNVFEERKRIPG